MQFTQHAIKRMRQRGLSKNHAIGVIVAGEKRIEGNRVIFTSADYIVITDKSEGIVITMFEETRSTDKRKNRTIHKQSKKQIRKLRTNR